MYQYKWRNICHLVQCALPDTLDGIVYPILREKLLPISERREAGLSKED